jgi:L-methionine (R)-S-oxide reductase
MKINRIFWPYLIFNFFIPLAFSICMNKQALFESIRPEFNAIIYGTNSRDEKLLAISQLLSDTFDHYDWVGFYLVDDEAERELILGPFVGDATDHIRIKFGEGICGQAAETLETFVVKDVTKEENYLACSLSVQSEIVVPIMLEDRFIGELDIDSHVLGAMDDVDKKELEKLCKHIAKLF